MEITIQAITTRQNNHTREDSILLPFLEDSGSTIDSKIPNFKGNNQKKTNRNLIMAGDMETPIHGLREIPCKKD